MLTIQSNSPELLTTLYSDISKLVNEMMEDTGFYSPTEITGKVYYKVLTTLRTNGIDLMSLVETEWNKVDTLAD